ncbi:MAG: sigma-70 family RNA polymerase sigma factor [Sedimentisphaerales bacterium]|nr:sigma-70 family RNA polymerase sigma factor [Sedimentisphaerales bacterium]
MDERSEKQLIQACRQGDKDAYAWLVRNYSRSVFAICMGILGNTHDAEDLTQDVLLRGFKGIGRLRETDQFRPWIFQIARNMCIDFLRRRKIGKGAFIKVRDRQERADSTVEQDYTFLERAIGRLPEKYRLPLMMYYFQEKSTEAVAEAMGISPAGVCSRLSRARQKLRTILDQQRQENE